MNNKYDLSILIPARSEMFLAKTVEDILKNKRGKTEIIVHLDGEWANPGIPDHPDLTIIYSPEAIGQRAGTNKACRLSRAKYVMKSDAHLAFDEGFDVKLMDKIEDDMTIVPMMRNLHVFDWVCIGKNPKPNMLYSETLPDGCGYRFYQGPTPEKCEKCGGNMAKQLMWRAKESPRSTSFTFDPTPHFQYFGDFKSRPEGKGELTETMSLQGSCFMLARKKYWELDICDEKFGSWGSQGIEVAVKTWLSGGRVMCLQTTWYAHLFRTQGSDFSFPYPQSGRQVQNAKKLAKDLFFENKWDKQIYPLAWLIEKFKPVPRWHDEENKEVLDQVMQAAVSFTGVDSVADLASSGSTAWLSKREKMTTDAMSSPGLLGTVGIPPENIDPMSNQSEMNRITTKPVIADMIDNRNILPKIASQGANEPSIHDSMNSDLRPIESDSTIPEIVSVASPDPTTRGITEVNLTKDSSDGFGIKLINTKDTHSPHYKHLGAEKSTPKKGIIFYTDNRVNLKIAHAIQDNLRKTGIPITSASLKPMPNFGKNIHIKAERGYLTMFKQQLAALEASDADIIYMCEHDVLYHPSHFDFVPPRKDKFYYNTNVWKVDAHSDRALWVDECRQVSGLVAYREFLIEEYKRRINRVETEGKFERGWGFEPGTKSIQRGGFSDYTAENFKSKHPNLDIRAEHNLTPNRWSKEQFRNQTNTIGWREEKISYFLTDGWNERDLRFLTFNS